MPIKLQQFIKKEAYLLPITICLFLVPLFFNPLFLDTFTQGKELLFRSVVFVSVLGYLVYALLRGNLQIKSFAKSRLFPFVIAAVFFSLVSTILSPTPLIAMFGTYHRGFGLITQAYLFCFLIQCVLVLKEEDIVKLLRVTFIVSVLIALYGLLQKTGFDMFFAAYNKDIFVGRVFSFLGNPGYFGQYMLLSIVIGSFFVFSSVKKYYKILSAGGILILLAGLWFSQTRTSVLALGICVLLACLKYRKQIWSVIKKSGAILKIAAVVAILLVVVCTILLPKDRFSLDETAMRSVNSRIEIWKGTVNLIAKKPFFGYGQETFNIYSPEVITKQFLTMEEDLNLSIDRIHNEFLETIFSYGIPAGIVYVMFFGYLIYAFMKSKNGINSVLLLVIAANMIQNQFSFSDISISVLTTFCLGGLISGELKGARENIFKLGKLLSYTAIVVISILGLLIFQYTIGNPFMSQFAYANSIYNYDKSYDVAVLEHKKAIMYAPNYSELWYELMFIDPSSMERALENIERIEGMSGNLLAWKGNYYAEKDPDKSSEYYALALEKNISYPNWIRSYADMLYKNGDYENALILYRIYLETVPDFWKWKDTLSEHTESERTSYRIFFKNVPDFWNTVERVKTIEETLKN